MEELQGNQVMSEKEGFVLSLRILLYQREVELRERLSITVVLQPQEQDRTRLRGERRKIDLCATISAPG